ncbi:MAG: 50S ribosomal protein L28 [bacterium]
MARICDFTGKKTVFGASRSHSMKQSKRTFKPNLITKMIDIGDGVKVKVKMSTKFYKKNKSLI